MLFKRLALATLLATALPVVAQAAEAPATTSVDQSNPYTLMNEAAQKTFSRLKNDQAKIKQNQTTCVRWCMKS